jgi:Fe2+ or Zn2+ uptake regulation protein
MTEEHFNALASFQDAISDELSSTITITRQRLFVLVYLCTHPRKGVTSTTIAAAARTLPAQWADGCVYRLRYRTRVYVVLRLLRRSGLITRVEVGPGQDHKYYPTQRTRSCIASFVQRARNEAHGARVQKSGQKRARTRSAAPL